jgi:hypothetical protein
VHPLLLKIHEIQVLIKLFMGHYTSAYLRKVGLNLDLEQVEKSIRDKPLPSAAIAAAADFILGGGMATRPGLAILAFLAWRVAKDTASNLVTAMIHGREIDSPF